MKQYHDLLEAIKAFGSYKEAAREGMPGTTSLFGYQNRFNLAEGFPILTTKKMYWKGIVAELLWFLRGDTNIKFLDEHGVTKMWHEDAYNFYLKNFKERAVYGNDAQVAAIEAEEPMKFAEFCAILRETPRWELPTVTTKTGFRYRFGDTGFQYGRVWRAWDAGKDVVVGHDHVNTWGRVVIDQIDKVIRGIRKNPYGRRHVVTAWDPAHDEELALTWCHALFQFNCRKISFKHRADIWKKMTGNENLPADGVTNTDAHFDEVGVPQYYLDCQLYQRSADVVLGVPFNISSYALLTHIIAKLVNMVPGEFVHTFGDVHIYDNHKAAVDEQLGRDYTKYKLPKLELGGDWSKAMDFNSLNPLDFSDLKIEDFNLIGYESYPKLESETVLSTGLKK